MAHQGLFGPMLSESSNYAMMQAMNPSADLNKPSSPFSLGVGDASRALMKNPNDAQHAGVHFEINATNQPGIYSIKARSEKPLANITTFSKTKGAVAQPSNPDQSNYSYQIEATIDVNNSDQPVTLTAPPVASITHVPAPKGAN